MAYVRALQLSQYSQVSDLPSDLRHRVEQGETPGDGAGHEEGGAHH